VTDQAWRIDGGTLLDRYQYGYDRAGNRPYKANLVVTGDDWLYGHDGLNRLVNAQRGALNANKDGIVGTPANENQYGLDALGNWPGFVQKTAGATALDQNRAHNAVNETGTITTNNGPAWVSPAHDLAGNMTSGPKPFDPVTRQHCVWDSWNRLAKVQADNGGTPGTTVAEYQYDGLNHRIVTFVPNVQNPANWDRTDCLVTAGWQDLEERLVLNLTNKTTAATTPKYQYVWDLRYIDALAVRDENKDADSSCTGTLDERLYYTADALFSATALVKTDGTILERYRYDPYGRATVLDASGAAKTDPNWSEYGNPWTFTGRRLDRETGMMYYRNRMYHAGLGRFVGRDPIGYNGKVWDLYEYVGSRPMGYLDPQGLWNEGNYPTPGQKPDGYDPNAESPTQGHSDFPGSIGLGGPFDYTKHDKGWTHPWIPWSQKDHFRPLDESENDLVMDVKWCNKEPFERHAHQMQDFFSHYGQGYTAGGWSPVIGLLLGGLPGATAGALSAGHAADTVANEYGGGQGPRPDNADDYRAAFNAAKARTKGWVDRWDRCCCLVKDKANKTYWGFKPGRSETDCGARPPEHDFQKGAPPGKRVNRLQPRLDPWPPEPIELHRPQFSPEDPTTWPGPFGW